MEAVKTPSSFTLSTLLVPSKVLDMEVPGHPGFKVSLCFLSREELTKIRKKATKTKFNNRTRTVEESLDEDMFLKLYTDSTIKNWSGLTLEVLEKLTLVDIQSQDKKAELTHTQEDAYVLMKNSAEFDGFISDAVGDLTNFTKSKTKQ
jgi:hypothetical protein